MAQKGSTLDPVEAEFAASFDLTKESEEDPDEFPSDPDVDLEASGALAITPPGLPVNIVKELAAPLSNPSPSTSKHATKSANKSGAKKKQEKQGRFIMQMTGFAKM